MDEMDQMVEIVLGRIKELAKQKNLSLYKIAKYSNLPQSSLNNLFSRNNLPTIATLSKICVGLGITLSDFFAYDIPLGNNLNKKQLEIAERYENLSYKDREMLEIFLLGLEKRNAFDTPE